MELMWLMRCSSGSDTTVSLSLSLLPFRKPTRTRVTPSGKIVRRTVLMESPKEDTSDVSQPMVSPELSSDQLRALADLEDARKTGKISETEYFKRRGAILRGEAP